MYIFKRTIKDSIPLTMCCCFVPCTSLLCISYCMAGIHIYQKTKYSCKWAVLHTYNHLSSGLECWNGCLVVVVCTFIIIHTMYFLYYTTRPAICKELHSVVIFLSIIKYQMIFQGNETNRKNSSFLQYLSLFWPVWQSRAAVEPNSSLSQNMLIS